MCDYPSSISDLKPIKTAISSNLYVITPSLSKTSLCKTLQAAYVCHHMRYTWHHLHTLGQKPLLFMASHPLYSLHNMRYIWHLIYSVWCHIHYVLHHTMTLSMTSNILCVWHTHLIWHHTKCYDHTTSVCLHSHYAWHYTQWILTLHTMYQFYDKKWM